MTPGRRRVNTWIATLAALLLFAPHAFAMMLVPPSPLSVAFEPRTERLAPEGLEAVDQLAVRAAQCPATGLVVRVQPARGVGRALTQRRMAAVRARLLGLGLKLRVVQEPLDGSWSREGREPPQDHVLDAEVGAGADVWCHLREGSQIFGWAQQLARHVQGATPGMPAFWQNMSSSVRLRELALPLAKAAYCDGALRCNRHPALYAWLAEQALAEAPTHVRRDWLSALWTMADDAAVEAFTSRWALPPLTIEEQASVAEGLVASGLPWAVIERRLMQPGLMPLFASRPMSAGGSGPHGLLSAAARRGELDSFDRLIDAAGPAKPCLVANAFFRAVGGEEDFKAWQPHFGKWAQGVSVPYQPQGLDMLSCNPAGWVLLDCAIAEGDEAVRHAEIWKALQQAGITTASPAIQSLKTRGIAVEGLQCEPPARR